MQFTSSRADILKLLFHPPYFFSLVPSRLKIDYYNCVLNGILETQAMQFVMKNFL